MKVASLHHRLPLIGAVGLLTIILTIIITQPTGVSVQAEAGEVASRTYKAPETVNYRSDLRTREAEDRAASTISPVNRTELTAPSQQEGKFSGTVAAITAIRAEATPGEQKIARLQEILSGLTQAEAESLLNLDEAGWQATQNQTRDILTALQAGQVRPEDTGRADQLATERYPAGSTAPRGPTILLVRKLLIANTVPDEEKTQAAQKAARESVEPVSYTIEKDQVIAYEGRVLSEFDVERLNAAGLTRPSFNVYRTTGVALLVGLLSILLFCIVPWYATPIRHSQRTLGLLGALAVAVTLAGVLLVPGQPILAYVVPVAAPVLLLAVFYGFAFALLAGACLTAFYALATGGSFELFFIHLATALGLTIFARRLTSTTSFIKAGMLATLIVFTSMLAFSLLTPNFDLANVYKYLIAAGLNGALTATFVFAGTAFLGTFLGRVTFLQLLELESPRQPLLRRLAAEAPGTYSHSLRMAAIVENVAEQIHADPLLARVQTLYHDIGKLAHPEYFVENQRGSNLHAGLEPKESANILRAHISEGLSLAAAARLPEQVAAAIPEHHGTSLMGYFWANAKQANKRTAETDFRYLGPRPQSKETAIIMLADAVEAASRTLENPDEQSIRNLVQELFAARLEDGQLDEAPLTTRELTRLREIFSQVIMSDLHKRIRYPRAQS